MDVREKLVELIESARYWGSNTSEEIADCIITSNVTVQEWKPISEQPKKKAHILFAQTMAVCYLGIGMVRSGM